MARESVPDGLKVIACTPYFFPGLYDNSGPDIRRRVQWLQFELKAAGVDCRLVPGCDAHIAAALVSKLKSGLAKWLDLHCRLRRPLRLGAISQTSTRFAC
jgi:protein-tyrosine phosphatase